ncbi:MAG: RNA helicase, partial [Methanosarcinaceae archaeon]|nr:RNA helicase [Methanosarcinaceae archaeon]
LLLRPTLSMRLFEQQLGRVIRLSKATGKTKGRVFEISDNFNSLYERFGDNVFGNRKIEQIQMLQPEIKLEELFSEGDSSKTIRALKAGKIKISKLDLISRKKEGERPREIPVRLPPTTLRARYFSQLLGLTEAKDVGLFEREKRELMRSALRFRVRGAEDAAEIAKLTILANKLKREAYEDRRLKDNSRRYKPKVFGEVEWLLKLRALNSLKYECLHLPLQEKNKALKLLGFEPDFRQIDSFRAKCLKRGSAQKTLPELIKVLAFVSRLSSEETYQFLEKKKKDQWKRELSPAVYWGSCFIEDSPEIRELFESTEWDRQVKNLIK